MRKKIIIAVGGTGGHVLPAQKIGKKLSERFEVVYLGVGLSSNPFFEKEGTHFYDIEGSGLAKGVVHCLKKNLRGIRDAKILLNKLKPDFVIGFGSYHSFPVLVAGAYLGIPYYLFEFNVVPGKVNRLFSRGATKVFIHFQPKRKKLEGNLELIDYSFEDLITVSQIEARLHFNLDPDKKTLLVFGGSQGAGAINDLVLKGAPQLRDQYQLLHFSGKDNDFQQKYTELSITNHVRPFCKRMDLAWTACDLAICRSGAVAMREILIFEKPAILIPYPGSKDDHQTDNAKYIEETVQGGTHLTQKKLTPEALINHILITTSKLDAMKQSIQEFKAKNPRPSYTHSF